MSGHSKWSTIKRKKGAKDAARSKVFTKIIKEITIAARLGGGDPDGNSRLRRALDASRAANMPNDVVERAVKKGTGDLEGVNYEDVLYEGVGPGGSLFIMEISTDNRNRTAAEVRKIFEKGGGQLSSSGAATWAFTQKGIIRLDRAAGTMEELFDKVLEAGAEDLAKDEGDEEDELLWVVTTARDELDAVSTALEGMGLTLKSAKLEYIPNTPKEITDPKEAEQLLTLYENLDDHDDAQNVFMDVDISDDALAAME